MKLKENVKKEVQKNWFVIYTRPRFERKVFEQLVEQGIEAFLPTQKTIRQWSDRRKVVEVPLFNSYVFVHITNKEYFNVLQVFGVVKFITFEGKAVVVPQKQIDALLLLTNTEADIETSCTDYKVGQKVEVVVGALKGLCGELIKVGTKNRVLVRIDHLEQNLLVKIPRNYLQ